jgi:hypothetical protein
MADGPEAFFAALSPELMDAGPDAFFAASAESSPDLGHHHQDHNEPMDEDIFEDDFEEHELDADEKAYMEELFATFPELSLEEGPPLESFKDKWRRLKKTVSGGVKSYVKEGKAQRAKKAAAKAAPTSAAGTTKEPVPLAAEPKLKAKSYDLPIGAQILVDTLGKLIHEDVHTSLTDLSASILKSKTQPDGYFANIALASAIGTLRLGVEAALKSGDMGKVVQQARLSQSKKTPLDTRTIDNLHKTMMVFATEMNTLCTGPSCNGPQRALEQGEVMGREMLGRLGETYLKASASPTPLNENNPLVRMGAFLTSLLGITQAQVTGQSEINAFVHSSVEPVWSAAMTGTNMKTVLLGHFQ